MDRNIKEDILTFVPNKIERGETQIVKKRNKKKRDRQGDKSER